MRHVATTRRGLAAIVPALAILAGCTINPVTGENQLDLMGEGQELQMGAALYPQYTQQSLGEVSDPVLQAYVNRVGKSLAAVGHRPGLPWEFNAVNDPAVNAYALPGGKISITRGLLARMESEDELAAVLGHETGHVTARHAAQQYTRQMFAQLAMVGAAVYLESQDVKNRELYMLGGMFGAQLALAHYSREQERQSDDLGFDYMIADGYNPRGMVDLMQILESGHQRQPNLVEKWFSTHPMTSERIDTVRARLKTVPPDVLNRPIKRTAFSQPTSKVRSQREAYDRLAEAQGLLSKEKAGEARRLLQQSVDEWRNDGLLRGYLAGALWINDQPGPAMTAAAEAMRDAPGIFAVQSIGGQIFVSQKKWQTALGALDRADTIMPGVPPIRFQRGRCLEALGQRVEAIKAYRWVAQAVPESELGAEAAARANKLGSQMN